MKKFLYISMIFAFFFAIQSCEKSQIQKVDDADPFSFTIGDDDNKTRGGGDLDPINITDPDDDEDLDEDDDDDNITDPDDDEDMDEDDDGK